MPISPCHQLVKDLKATIDARMTGKQVSSVGHRGRSLEYAETPLKELIAYYNQVRNGCADALADPELIEVRPLDQQFGTRGRPAQFMGRRNV